MFDNEERAQLRYTTLDTLEREIRRGGNDRKT